MNFLTGLLASIIRPIIQEEIRELKVYLASEYRKMVGIKATSKEAKALKVEWANASSEAEREAVLDKISNFFDDIGDSVDGL